jgi:acid phosphatase class B
VRVAHILLHKLQVRRFLAILHVFAVFFLIGTAAPAPAHAELGRNLDAPLAAWHANRSLKKVFHAVEKTKDAVVVFDIDDTLVRWPSRDSKEPYDMAGAAEYVNALKARGAKIVYLTGRWDKKEERSATEKLLRDFGLPLDGATLIMNGSDQPTVEYKRSALARIRQLGTPVAFFDNEKENVRMFREEFPDKRVWVLRPATVSSREDPGGHGRVDVFRRFVTPRRYTQAPRQNPLNLIRSWRASLRPSHP